MSDPLEPTGRLVETGRFRVDAARALAKLGRFQLPDPWLFVRCWLRSAVLSGATRVAVRSDGGISELRFDGRPFPPGALKDPLGVLFAEEAGTDAGLRDLAAGLLGARRLSPRTVVLRTPAGDAGVESRFGPDGELTCGPCPALPETVFRLEWAEGPDEHTDRFRSAVAEASLMFRGALIPEGAGWPSRPEGITYDGAGASAGRRFALVAYPSADAGCVVLHRNGIRLQRVFEPGLGALAVHADDDRLGLDLTRANGRRDERLLETVRLALSEAFRKYPGGVAELHPPAESSLVAPVRMADAASLLRFLAVGPVLMFAGAALSGQDSWLSGALTAGGAAILAVEALCALHGLRRKKHPKDGF